MLPIEIINNPDAIEKEFCIPFSLLPIDEMDSKDEQMFVQITNMKEEIGDKPEGIESLMKIKGYSVLEDLQNKMLTAKFCFRTKLWLLHICKSDLALAYLYLIYLQYCAKKNPICISKKENLYKDRVFVNFRFFCEKCFPEGFPNPINIQALFNTLYINSPNGRESLISHPNCMKSIQFSKSFQSALKQPETKQEATGSTKSIGGFNISNSLLNFALSKNK